MRTGIIRRIDDLGRITLPVDIRKMLRLREGDPLEIFVDHEGEVILRKHFPIKKLGNFAQEYADVLHETLGLIAMIADYDVIIAVAGANKREFLSKHIGNAVQQALEERVTIIHEVHVSDDENLHVIQTDWQEYIIKSQVIAPIITQGDPIGAVIVASKNAEDKLGDIEVKLAKTAAAFLAKQMEQ